MSEFYIPIEALKRHNKCAICGAVKRLIKFRKDVRYNSGHSDKCLSCKPIVARYNSDWYDRYHSDM
ncbi:MAG: hypothetical protein KAR06_01360 [Deltaproteobacteria bacterium]|nr:hypothetical protein [Deltaproteobacteria bacterium]